MYHVKMAFVLIQVGTKLWVNPVQIQGIAPNTGSECPTIVLIAQSSPDGTWCSDWAFEKVKAALSPAAVSKAMETK